MIGYIFVEKTLMYTHTNGRPKYVLKGSALVNPEALECIHKYEIDFEGPWKYAIVYKGTSDIVQGFDTKEERDNFFENLKATLLF